MKRTIVTAAALALCTPALALGAGDEPANIFAGTIYQAIAAGASFLILLAVLWRYAWGPILQGLQDRENAIRHDLDEARSASEKAKAVLAEYQAKLSQAQAEAQKMVEQARTDAARVAAAIKDEAQTEITNLKQRAESDIRAAREQALAEIYARAADLSTTIAGRILQREIRPEDQRELVDRSLAELTTENNN